MNVQQFSARQLLFGLLFVWLTACAADPKTTGPSAETVKAGRALFDERCETVAGQKIYRTVEDVEGIVLLKVRPKHTDADLTNRDWPGAAFAKEYTDDEFIKSFLVSEGEPKDAQGRTLPTTPSTRGSLVNGKTEHPGYRYVDVIDEKTGEVWRYSSRWEEPWQYDKSYLKGYVKFILDRKPAPKERPRYGVTYEDHVIPKERAMGLASSTVKVVDLKTNEVLGEMTMYAWTHGVLYTGRTGAVNAVPWLSAYRCGNLHHWAGFETRLFIDQVLIPRKGG